MSAASAALQTDAEAEFYSLFVPDEGAAVLRQYTDLAALGDYVRTLRESAGCLYMFRGSRILLDTRNGWSLHCGDEEYHLDAAPAGPVRLDNARLPAAGEPVIPEDAEDRQQDELLPEYDDVGLLPDDTSADDLSEELPEE